MTLFLCFSSVNVDYSELQQHNLHDKSSGGCINTRSPAASQPFIGWVTEQTTLKLPIGRLISIGINYEWVMRSAIFYPCKPCERQPY